MLQDCLDLRSEDEAPVLLVEIKRLDADAISGEHELLALGVPDGNAEIAFEVGDEIQARVLRKCAGWFLSR